MIVKDESHIIERNLRCTLPTVDTWCIVDTGSTDNTKDIITRITNELGKPGFLYERKWVNFGKNRSEALELAAEHMEWAFMIDADDTIEGSVDKSNLDGNIDGYTVSIRHGTIIHRRPHLFNLKRKWGFVGVLHESARCFNGIGNLQHYSGHLQIQAHTEGARSKNPDRFKNDAILLENEIAGNPENLGRSLFYLAESYRFDNQLEKALEVYRRRTQERNSGWYEEIYCSYIILIQNATSPERAIGYAWKAQEVAHDRREAVYEAMRYCRKKDHFTQQLYAMGMGFKDIPVSDDHLFTQPGAYGWSYDDELSIIAFYTKHYTQSFELSKKAIKSCPPQESDRIFMNIAFSEQKLKRGE